MAGHDDGSPTPDPVHVVAGRWHDVWIMADLLELLNDRITAAERLIAAGKRPDRSDNAARQMKAVIAMMAERGRHRCQPNMLRGEGLHSHAGISVRLYAFKAGQLRIYGGFVDPDDNPRRFLATAADWAKKSDKPSKEVLKRTMRLFVDHADAVRNFRPKSNT